MRWISIVAFSIVFVVFAVQFTLVSADDAERRQIVAVKVETPPKIGGKLDDSAWQQAEPSEGFTQNYPDRGDPMSQRTVVRILYDGENIYVGFQCYDSESEKVIGAEMRRDYDGVWKLNDFVRFVFDTHHDHLQCFFI